MSLQQCLELLNQGDWSDLDLCVIHAQCSLWLVFFANDNSLLNPWNDRVMELNNLPITQGTEPLLDEVGQLETAEEMFEIVQEVARQIKLRIDE